MRYLLLAILLCLPSYAGAQVLATIPVMADDNHTPGVPGAFGPVTVPQAASFYRVVFDSKDALSGDQTLRVNVQRSVNGGLTQEPGGGNMFSATSQPATFVVPLPQAGADYRTLSGQVLLYGGRWRGRVFIEIE
jgi:hypothetical protein